MVALLSGMEICSLQNGTCYFIYKLLFLVYLRCFQIYVEEVTFYLDVKTLQCLLSFLAMIGSRLFNSEKESIKSS